MRRISSCSPAVAIVASGVSSSLGIVNGAGLADHGDLDLSRILELALDPPRDVARQPDGFVVADLLALDHDANLTAGLQRERLRHALEGVGNLLELLEALDIGLEQIA